MDESLTTYLALTTGGADLLPGVTNPPRVRPHFAHALLVNLNQQLLRSEWVIVDDKVVHRPQWKRPVFRAGIQRRQQWVGTTPQLNTTIDQFEAHGLLYEAGATVSLLDLLSRHAAMFRTVILKQDAPVSWLNDRKACLAFNAPVFEFIFWQVGMPWRRMRDEINGAVNSFKGLRTAQDPLAENPAWYAVVNLIGTHGSLTEMALPSIVQQVGWTRMVGSLQEIHDALAMLVQANILLKEDDAFELAPRFRKTFELYTNAIKSNLPVLKENLKEMDTELSADNNSPISQAPVLS